MGKNSSKESPPNRESETKVFRVPTTSEISKLVSDELNSTDQAVHYSRFFTSSTNSGARPIADSPYGFDDEDIMMAEPERDKEAVWNFLKLSQENQERDYQIGVAFVSDQNISDGKIHLGHAAVVLRDHDLNEQLTLRFVSKITEQVNGELPTEDNLRLLHLCFNKVGGKPDEMVLALEPRMFPLKFYRHIELLQVRTTERLLKHIAVQSCPRNHRDIVDDCATFARNFFRKLLTHLRDCGAINEKDLEDQVRTLVKHIHIEDGSAGKFENESRENRTLGEVGNTSVRRI
ncbi:uncharacterized protein K444DRAFT_302973 [Hyaloscypha bicolor E]|uniref:Uncharacterized protein n=1 Tax=Hyaloscypha bicolor E TaxID=1095630 RepID=A0A2J6TNB3_9HELO|nr:uncharacterized protein K444DRAFT_302973 [Hyaloscypha bicolor E]PMD64516.1 hypothetical protein K444DRAFT_302973 [Hyaloscypha bicolor E]